MNLQIFNSIVNGELKPWLVDIEESTLKEIVRQSNKMPVNDLQQVANKLKHLSQPFNNIQKSIPVPTFQEIKQQAYLSYNIEAATLLQHYYKGLIDAALVIYYNEAVNNPFIKDNALDVPFQIGEKSLKGISVLCNQANNELKERGFDDVTPFIDITHFALTYLRNNLLALYFSIQSPFKEYLTNTYNSFEDYALYCLDDRNFEFKLIETPKEVDSIAKSDNKAFNFGFKGEAENLTNLIKVLCVHKNLLDESVTKPTDLIELFTTKDINTKTYKIKLGCKTNLFTYIVICLKKVLPKLTFANIDRCNYFYSDNDTPIRQSVLSNSKSNNPISKEIKAEIDKIFKENNI